MQSYIRLCPTTGPADTTTTDTTVTDTTGSIDDFGAIIKEVIYYPGTGFTSRDTLQIMLTEPVDCGTITEGAVKEIFVFNDDGKNNPDALTDATLVTDSECEGTMVSRITITVPYQSLVITPEKDSLVLAEETPYVVDEKGDVPPPEMTPVVIRWGNAGVTIGAQPNPASATTSIDKATRDIFSRNFTEVPHNGDTYTGTIIGVQTIRPFLVMEDPPASSGTGDVYGLANIYDVTGNLVAEQLPLKLSNHRGVYGVYWNMRNRVQRVVGRGAYLMMVTVQTDSGQKPMLLRTKIGVR